MKMAAAKALAKIAKEKVPDVVLNAFGGRVWSLVENISYNAI